MKKKTKEELETENKKLREENAQAKHLTAALKC